MSDDKMEAICKVLVRDLVNTPCDISTEFDYMEKHSNEWCAEHCESNKNWMCWKRWLELKLGEAEC